MKPTVYFPIETTVRELDGKLLLSSFLLDKGYRIVLGSRHRIKQWLMNSPPSLFVAKSISLDEEEFYKQLKSKGHKIALLHAEGGILYKDMTKSIEFSYPDQLAKYVDHIFTYGSEIYEAILKHTQAYSSEKLSISGEPRFDLMKPKFNSFYEGLSQLKQVGKGYVLINTSFGLSNHIISDKYAEDLVNGNPNFSDSMKKNLFKKKKEFKKLVQDFIDLTLKVSNEFPELQVVLRPHPEENLDTYRNAFKGKDNILVNNQGAVGMWIRNAAVVIHYDCTTGVEAYFNEKPVISFAPFKNEELDAWLPMYISKELDRVDAVLNELTQIFEGEVLNYRDDEKNKMLSGFISNIMEDSGPRFLKVVEELLPKDENKAETKFPIKTLLIFKLLDIYQLFKKPKVTPAVAKLGVLGAKEISVKMAVLGEINEKKRKLRTKKIAKNLIEITSR